MYLGRACIFIIIAVSFLRGWGSGIRKNPILHLHLALHGAKFSAFADHDSLVGGAEPYLDKLGAQPWTWISAK
jgi:hypothetical protein